MRSADPRASAAEGSRAEDRERDAGGALPIVAIVGRANVGKSTLFNRLARQRRSLVEDRPGVTRDRVSTVARIEGRDVLLVDTGGLDPEAEEGIPAAIRAQVRDVVRDAAVILFVADARGGLLPGDREIADLLRQAGGQVVVVANKADNPKLDAAAAEFHSLGFDEVVPASAEHRLGMVDVEIAIRERLPAPAPRSHGDREVPRLAIIGRPNVGKSSLLNRLLGTDRNIVADEPGTTRDATDSLLEVDGRRVWLVDTAGIRRPAKRSERLERGSAFMAVAAIERADVALLVIDAAEGVTDQDCRIARMALDRGRPVILVLNKWDRVEEAKRAREVEHEVERRLAFVPEPVVLRVSAKTGRGTARLVPGALELLDRLHVEIPTAEINRALREAIEALAPPLRGRRRARFFYATQSGTRPFTVLIFMNDPDLLPDNYRRYLESFFRKRYEIRSAPVRLRFRRRSRPEDEEIKPIPRARGGGR